MIELTKLTEREKDILRKMVLYQCEGCQKMEDEVGKLQVHRIRQGNNGGIYHLRNIKILCSSCHRKYHENNYAWCKSK